MGVVILYIHLYVFRWHTLTILHYNRTVTVYLDGQEFTRDIKGPILHLGLDPKVFIGGGDNFVVTRGLCYCKILQLLLTSGLPNKLDLFDLIFYVPVNNFSVMSGQAFLS